MGPDGDSKAGCAWPPAEPRAETRGLTAPSPARAQARRLRRPGWHLAAPFLLAWAAACGGPAGTAAHRPPGTTPTTAPGESTTTLGTSGAQWTTYGGGTARASADTAEGPLSGAPTKAWTSSGLDGAVYGEPLLFDGEVLVATENDTVYALAATNGATLWSVHLGTAVPASRLPCGDITPVVGVTSTMTVDPASGTLFVSGATINGASVVHSLYAIDISTHAVAWRRALDQPGWVAADELQRAGLALDDGNVLVSFGGNYGDCGSYHGWVIGVPESGTGALLAYRVPTANEGAIWAPPGPAVNTAGDVFVATGNGSAGAGQPFDHGDAVVELTPSLSEQQYWAPADWAQLNADDLDLGSTSPVLVGSDELFEVGKGGAGYLLHTASLGGVGGPAEEVGLCNSRGATAYDAALSALYVVCTDTGTIDEVTLGGGHLQRGWTWSSPGGGASSATLARGLLWVVDQRASTLYGIDPSTGATRVSSPLATGALAHYVGVSAGEGLLVVAGHAVEAFR